MILLILLCTNNDFHVKYDCTVVQINSNLSVDIENVAHIVGLATN